MSHNRKLVIGGVALTKARVNQKMACAAMDRVRDEIERELVQSDFFNGAPFTWIGLIIREGLKDAESPHYYNINKAFGDLPLAIEIDVNRLIAASEDEIAHVYREAALIALTHASDRYGLRKGQFERLRHRR